MTTILSYNVNGIRAATKKGLFDYLDESAPDIVCIQETKAQEGQYPLKEIEASGYEFHAFHQAEKKGYSGVGIWSKSEPDRIVVGSGMEKYDAEGRIIRADFGDWSLLNCYFPSGTTGTIRQDFKMEYLEDFFNWISQLKKERPNLIIVGDYNIAHTEIDIHNPKSNKKTSGFLPEEREWMTKWFNSGFNDAYRLLFPEKVEYSWWSYRAGARAKNKGWRIDYQSVSDSLKEKVRNVKHIGKAIHSDHCPVWMEIDL